MIAQVQDVAITNIGEEACAFLAVSAGTLVFVVRHSFRSGPVKRDVLGGIQRVLELEAMRVDRQNR